MNEQQLQKSERIASSIMRILATIGLVSVLALFAWVIVLMFRFAPEGGSRMSAAVSSVTSLFSTTPKESITIELPTRTFTSGGTVTMEMVYTGATPPNNYQFSYSCAEGVTAALTLEGTQRDLACETPITLETATVQLRLTSTTSRFADVDLTISAGALKDTTMVTVVNTDLSATLPSANPTATSTRATTTPTNTVTTPRTPSVTPSTPKPTKPVSQPIDRPVSAVKTPADLALNIENTGILVRSTGGNKFYPVTPIPQDKTAAVTFTVTNLGTTASGAWAFRAWLPTEGDADYRYSSPAQPSLKPGMQVEYTLGFDEVIDAKTGTIKIELVPTDKTDKATNNTDSVRISIR